MSRSLPRLRDTGIAHYGQAALALARRRVGA
jgi:hypothetical protein